MVLEGTDQITFVTHYEKIDHLQEILKSTVLVWIDAEFHEELNYLRTKLQIGS